MKKQRKLLMSLMMVAAMVVSTFAGTVTDSTTAKAAETTTLIPAKVTDYLAPPASAKVTATLAGKNGNAAATADSTAVVVPVKMDYAGVLDLGVAANATTSSITATLYQDTSCTQAVGSAFNLTTSNKYVDTKSYTVGTSGTFYLKVKWASVVPEKGVDIVVAAFGYSGEEITLSKTPQLVFTGNSDVTKYHKLSVKADGLVTIMGYSIYNDTASSLSLALCDKNKKQLGSISLSSSNKYGDYIALKKGTYYVAAKTASPYQLQCSTAKVSDQSGASKKKAKVIKKKKTVKGMVTIQDKTSKVDWYSFTLKKNAKATINLKAYCSGSSRLKIEFIPANPNYHVYNNTASFGSGSHQFNTKKIRKGKYYIKITKLSKSYSGSYSIKYVK